jgi:broad specificity phosphatase PhoE
VLSIVRHARTEANAGGRLQGRLDLPLDDVGRQQAAALAGFVPDVDRVICSPALRARQTAEVFGLEPTIDERWQEIAYGEFEGTKITDVPADLWLRWISDPDFAPAGGETLRAMGERVFAALDDIATEARDRHVVVVSHATPVKVAMAWALGVQVDITWRCWVDQASVTRIAVRDRGPALLAFNALPG